MYGSRRHASNLDRRATDLANRADGELDLRRLAGPGCPGDDDGVRGDRESRMIAIRSEVIEQREAHCAGSVRATMRQPDASRAGAPLIPGADDLAGSGRGDLWMKRGVARRQ